MTPDTFNFNGDAVTFLGLVGVISTAIIITTSFKRFYNSPYNIRVKPKQVVPETSNETETPVS
jgi:hypothetical protein